MEQSLKKRKLLIISGVVLLLVFLIWQVIRATTVTIINLTTNDPSNTSTIHQSNGPFSLTGTGNLSAHVHAGTYTLTVSKTANGAVQKVINVKTGQTMTVYLAIPPLSNPEPASSRDAIGLVVGNSAASFIDNTNGFLYSIIPDGSERLIDNKHSFASAQWSDPSYGVIEDANNGLFVANNGAVAPLALPVGFAKKPSVVSYSITPDRTIYISDGNTIYKQTYGGSFQVTYSPTANLTPISIISVEGHTILAKKSVFSAQGDAGDAGEYIVVDSSGKTHTREGLTYVASLSPDGTYIALSGNGVNEVFDTNFKNVIGLPVGLTAPAWLDNNTLLYGESASLWKFNVSSGLNTRLADLSSIGYVGQVTVDQSGAYAYLRVQRTTGGDGFQLERVGLKGQSASNTAVGLGVFLPNTVSGCSMGYENFVRLTIIVQGPAAQKDSCLLAANNYLALYNVDTTGIVINFSATD